MDSMTVGRELHQVTTGLRLHEGPMLGSVTALDANRLEVELRNPESTAQVTVSDLVALPTDGDVLVGMVDAVTDRRDRGHDSGLPADEPRREARVELRIMPLGTFRPGDHEAPDAFTRGASAYPHIGGSCHLIDGDHLHRFMAILAEGVGAGERLVLGKYVADHEAAAIADGNRLFQRHMAVLGSTGAGKSWAVALILERAAMLSHANLIVFDLHGEYGPLTSNSALGEPVARRFSVAGPGDLGRTSDDLLYLPHWLFERDELMTLVLNQTDPHASDQVFRFTEHVQTLKQISLADAGREEAIATFTVDSPIPYRIDHLIQMLKADDTEKIPRHPSNRLDPGPYMGRLTGLISRLEARASDPRYGFIFGAPESTLSYEWLAVTAAKLLGSGQGQAGIKVIDLSEVPSAIVPIVAGVLARLIYEIQFWIDAGYRTPVSLICDEAHLYIPPLENSGPVHHAALRAFEAIAKEGRKYGVGLIVVSQRPADVSRTILSQCNNFVVMRMTNDLDRAMVEQLIPETITRVTGVLPALDPGEAVVIGDALVLPTRVKLDPPAIRPSSTTQPYWTLWANKPSSQAAIAAGAEALRNQFRAEPTQPAYRPRPPVDPSP
jgi:Helicase HerA, central domain